MLLFLDVVSPIPEFFIIEDNKLIFQRKIIENKTENLSDYIFETYIKINKEYNLDYNLKKIVMTIGPGSYTSLRIGAAFVSGLCISNNLEFYPLSITDMYDFKANNKFENIAFFIYSSKNQKFLCSMRNNKISYKKIENGKDILQNNISKIFYNIEEYNTNLKKLEQIKFSFIDEVMENHSKFVFKKNNIIKPIYVSNNNILN